MQFVIVTDEHDIGERVCNSLSQSGIAYSIKQIVSQEAARTVLAEPGLSDQLILFCGSKFLDGDIARLEQISSRLDAKSHIVAVGMQCNAATILKVIRSGAIDYLDLNTGFVTELSTLIERLRSRGAASRSRLFTVVGASSGAGASVIASNLAASMAQDQRSCGLLDLHLRGGNQAQLFNLTVRHTLGSLASKSQQLDRVMFQQALTQHECGVQLLASPEHFSDFRQFTPQVIQKVLQLACETWDDIVVDLEDAEHTEQLGILAASDYILIPLHLDFVSLSRTKLCLDHLTNANIPLERIVLIANRTGQPKELSIERTSEALGVRIRYSIPDDPGTVNASLNLGTPLVVSAPQSAIALSMKQMTASLLGVCTVPNTAGGLLGVRSIFQSLDSRSFRGLALRLPRLRGVET